MWISIVSTYAYKIASGSSQDPEWKGGTPEGGRQSSSGGQTWSRSSPAPGWARREQRRMRAKGPNRAHDSINQVKASEKWHVHVRVSTLPIQKRYLLAAPYNSRVNQSDSSRNICQFGVYFRIEGGGAEVSQLREVMIFEILSLETGTYIKYFDEIRKKHRKYWIYVRSDFFFFF